MPDMRLKKRAAKNQSVQCDCGWRVWREDGYTRAEAAVAHRDHIYNECEYVPNLIKMFRTGEF